MSIKIISKNRKAFHNYQIGDSLEAGIVLQGTEVKALRAAKVNLQDGWVDIKNGEAFLNDIHIGHYSHGNRQNHLETRSRKLLFNKKEIDKLERQMAEKGVSLVPLKIYFKGRHIKVEVGLGKGKKLFDKRESSKQKDAKRQIDRAMKSRG